MNNSIKTAFIFSLALLPCTFVSAQPYSTDAAWKNIKMAQESSYEIAAFVVGNRDFTGASCEAIFFRPNLQSGPIATSENRIECTVKKLDGESKKVTKFFDNSPVEAWGSKWSEHSAISIFGSFAEELSNYMASQYLKSKKTTKNGIWSSYALCDMNLNLCTDEYSLHTSTAEDAVSQIFCVRWTEAIKADDHVVMSSDTLDEFSEELKSIIQLQLNKKERRITRKWCTIR